MWSRTSWWHNKKSIHPVEHKSTGFLFTAIFEKKLYMLIPFYIFVYEKDLESINEDEQKQNELLEVYSKITEKLGTGSKMTTKS